MISFAAIVPHSPALIPGIGKPEDFFAFTKTILAMERLGRELEERKPDKIVVVSSHTETGDLYSFGINHNSVLSGDFQKFGLPESMSFKNDLSISEKIYRSALSNEMLAHYFKSNLDHGVLVPLYFLARKMKIRLVHLASNRSGLEAHYRFGQLVGLACSRSSHDVAILAGGNLSVDEKVEKRMLDFLENKNVETLLGINPLLVGGAQDCGLRSILMLLGAIKGQNWNFQKYSHERQFGVGHLVARLV